MFFLITKILLENVGSYGDKKIYLGLNPVTSEEIGFIPAKDEREAAEKLKLKRIIFKGQPYGYFLPQSRYDKELKILNQEPKRFPRIPSAVFVYYIEELIEITQPLE